MTDAGNGNMRAGLPDLRKYRLVFGDNFNGHALNTAVWDYRQENATRDGSVNLRANVTVSNGILHLAGNRTAHGFSSGMISTENSFHFKYGYAECRADVSRISFGADVTFWLQSDKNGSTMDPAADGGEIDIAEYNLATGGRDLLMHNLHWNGYGAKHRTQGTHEVIPGISGSGYHVFGLEWTPQAYIFYVDGSEKYRCTENVSHHSEYIILSNLIMDNGFGGDRMAGHFPEYLDVDYVKVYQLRGGRR
jgi:beta-glucanase (GH16 family)